MKLCEYYKEEFKTNYSKLKNKETRNSQIPNILTLSRLLSPIIIIPLVISGNLKIALIFIILFALTDLLDGYIARKYNLVTTFGKFADPLADKMLVLTSFLILMVQNDLQHYPASVLEGWPYHLTVTPLWAVAIILIRELMVSGVRLVAAQKGEVIAAGMSGKVKTFVTMIALIFAFIATVHVSIAILALVLVYVSVILTIYSGIVYLKNAKDILLESV